MGKSETTTKMLEAPDGPRPAFTRRSFLQAIGLAFASGFTAIADDLAWLMRWCCLGGGLRHAGAG